MHESTLNTKGKFQRGNRTLDKIDPKIHLPEEEDGEFADEPLKNADVEA